jgi:hypothetical protein
VPVLAGSGTRAFGSIIEISVDDCPKSAILLMTSVTAIGMLWL